MLVPLDTKCPISVFDQEEALAFLVTKGGRRYLDNVILFVINPNKLTTI